jgi:hypothetical protein
MQTILRAFVSLMLAGKRFQIVMSISKEWAGWDMGVGWQLNG